MIAITKSNYVCQFTNYFALYKKEEEEEKEKEKDYIEGGGEERQFSGGVGGKQLYVLCVYITIVSSYM